MQVIGKNTNKKFILPEAVFCCLQTCDFCFDETYHSTSGYLALVARGPIIQCICKLWV